MERALRLGNTIGATSVVSIESVARSRNGLDVLEMHRQQLKDKLYRKLAQYKTEGLTIETKYTQYTYERNDGMFYELRGNLEITILLPKEERI